MAACKKLLSIVMFVVVAMTPALPAYAHATEYGSERPQLETVVGDLPGATNEDEYAKDSLQGDGSSDKGVSLDDDALATGASGENAPVGGDGGPAGAESAPSATGAAGAPGVGVATDVMVVGDNPQTQPDAVVIEPTKADHINKATEPDKAISVEEDIVVEDAAEQAQAPESASGLTVQSESTTNATVSNKQPTVSVLAYMQRKGWAKRWAKKGAVAGIVGKGLRLEAVRLHVAYQGNVGGSIQYCSYVQSEGWQEWKQADEVSGTTDKSRRIEAVQVRLTGRLAKQYDVYYRVYVEGLGWMAWANNGHASGTAGKSLRVEALQVVLVPKGGAAPAQPSDQTKTFVGTEEVQVAAHVQTLGWLPAVGNGKIAGTTGRALRVEALRATLVGTRVPGGVETSAYMQGMGWMDWSADGTVAGVTGKSLRMEAFKMRLTGEAAKTYDLYYRVHVQGVGWLGWAKNGQVAGAKGLYLRVEALQTRLVRKGRNAPSNGSAKWQRPAINKLNVAYASKVSGAWQDQVESGATSGTIGQEQNVQALRVTLVGKDADGIGSIQYSLHERGGDWTAWASDGAVAKTLSAGKRPEAIRVRLTGVAASIYDVWYRVRAQSFGWMGWTRNGQAAGTLGMAKRLEAIQIRLVPKQKNKAPGSTVASLRDGTVRMALDAAPSTRAITAFGGYNLSSGVASRIKGAIDYVRGNGYDLGFIMMDLGTHRGVSYNCDALFYSASSIKGPYIASVVNQHPNAIVQNAYDITETLFYSSNYNYKQILSAYGKGPMRTLCAESGARMSIAESLPWVVYSARDLAKLWGRMYQLFEDNAAGGQLGVWFERPNVSTIHATLSGKYRTRSKPGWINAGGDCDPSINGGGPRYVVSNDGGIVYARNGHYVMAIMSSVPAYHDMLNGLTAALDAAHDQM